MRTAVDSSVLIDILIQDPEHCMTSLTSLKRARSEGTLVICETVLAEICPIIATAHLTAFLYDAQINFVPSSIESSYLAGYTYSKYLARGGKQRRVVADFIIAAHAKLHADRLLTRDRGFYRDYFKGLKLI